MRSEQRRTNNNHRSSYGSDEGRQQIAGGRSGSEPPLAPPSCEPGRHSSLLGRNLVGTPVLRGRRPYSFGCVVALRDAELEEG